MGFTSLKPMIDIPTKKGSEDVESGLEVLR
jgi:hypothetical protein